jgi:hypothetical protein
MNYDLLAGVAIVATGFLVVQLMALFADRDGCRKGGALRRGFTLTRKR